MNTTMRGALLFLGVVATVARATPATARQVAYIGAETTVAMVDTATHTIERMLLVRDLGIFGITQIAPHPVNGRLYVGHNFGVAVLHPMNGTLLASIVTPNIRRLVFSSDGQTAYAAADQSVLVIHTASNSTVTEIMIDRNVRDIGLSPDGSRLYVTTGREQSHNAVYVIDTAMRRVRSTILIESGADRIVISADGRKAYVLASHVQVVDLENEVLSYQVHLPNRVTDLALSPDGRIAYLAVADRNAIDLLDTETRTVVATIAIGISNAKLVLNAEGTLAYAFVGRYPDACEVVVIDTTTRQVIGSLDFPYATTAAFVESIEPVPTATPTMTPRAITSPAPPQICAYTSHNQSGQIMVIDVHERAVVGSIAVPQASRLAMSASGERVYVNGWINGRSTAAVVVIDTFDNTVQERIPILAGETFDVDVAGDDRHVYAALGPYCRQVAVIDTQTHTVRTLGAAVANDSLFRIAVTPNGETAFLTSTVAHGLRSIDLITGAMGAPIPLGIYPFNISLNPDRRHVYGGGSIQSTPLYPGAPAPLAAVDMDTGLVVHPFDLPTAVTATAVRPGDGAIAVTRRDGNGEDGALILFDADTYTARDPIPIAGYPNSLAFVPESDIALVGRFNPNDIVIVDTTKGMITATITLPEGPQDLAVGFVPGGCAVPVPPSPTPTPTPIAHCVGDCDFGTSVDAIELMIGVQIALGWRSVPGCEAFDPSLDGHVTIEELVRAVADAVGTCRGDVR